MRSKLILAAVLTAGVLAFGVLTPTASAHPPGGYDYYYGNGGHDFAPHYHQYDTPYGSYSYYGNGLHDLVPHDHVYVNPGYYGGYSGYSTPYDGYSSGYYSPYGSSYSPGYPSYYGGRRYGR